MNKHTVIVGGASGLGREAARLFAGEGHVVSVIGSRKPEDVRPADFAQRYFQIDITDDAALNTGLSQVFEGQEHLSNLVFTQRYRGKSDQFQGELETSVLATRRLIESLVEKFSHRQPGAIVLVSSVYGGFVGESQPIGYHLAKSSLDQMVRYFAVKLGKQGIRVNGVSPSTFQKEESKEYYQGNKALADLYEKITPLGRMGTAREIAEVIAFLCSERASFVTGQNIVVDGGVSLHSQESLVRDLLKV